MRLVGLEWSVLPLVTQQVGAQTTLSRNDILAVLPTAAVPWASGLITLAHFAGKWD